MPRRINGGVIGVANLPTTATASGVWSLFEVELSVLQQDWPLNNLVEYLVVAGGGSGAAAGNQSGTGSGGGAGGFRAGSITLVAGTSYSITVGAGGAAKSDAGLTQGNAGSDSVFSTITAAGGGGGGRGGGQPSGNTVGGNGGSGGGGGANDGAGGAGNTPNTSPSQPRSRRVAGSSARRGRHRSAREVRAQRPRPQPRQRRRHR